MGSLRNLWRSKHNTDHDDDETLSEDEIGFNAHRDHALYWWTKERYIIAQDVMCQYDYVQNSHCAECGGGLHIAAHLNRAGQGLSELVAICTECSKRTTFIIDISNDVYQAWWAGQLGSLYVRQYEESPREPFSPE